MEFLLLEEEKRIENIDRGGSIQLKKAQRDEIQACDTDRQTERERERERETDIDDYDDY